VGYVGAVDWRMDLTLLAAIADRVPDVTLRLVGRVTAEAQPAVDELAARPNVEVLGQLTGAALADAVESLAVGLNPVTPSWYADCLHPCKVYEYAAHGVPCVSTDVAEALALPLVTTAHGTDDVVAAVMRLLDEPVDRSALRTWAAANTWDHRGDQFDALLISAGLG